MSWGLETTRLNGRAALPVSAEVVRELTPEDLAMLTEERGEQKPKQLSTLSMLSERHRNLARLIAMGKTDWECSIITGYTISRISLLKSDPAMKNLISHYREDKDIVYIQAQEKMAQANSTALDVLQERLENPEHVAEMSDAQLLKIIESTADRSGLGPTTKSEVSVNVNIADRLEAARKRVHDAKMAEAKMITITPTEVE